MMISLPEFWATPEYVEKYHIGSVYPPATLCYQIPKVLRRVCQRPGSRQVNQSESCGPIEAIPPDNICKLLSDNPEAHDAVFSQELVQLVDV